MKFFRRLSRNNFKLLSKILNVFTIIFFLALPYYLFEGRLFAGGDSSRLMYAFPYEYVHNVVFFSWTSAGGAIMYYTPTQWALPFFSILIIFKYIFNSGIIVSYLSYSAVLILGFIFFKKFLKETIEDYDDKFLPEIFFGGLIYCLSPIFVIDQLSSFLSAIWLFPLIPIFGYYFLRYLRSGKVISVFYASIWAVILSLGLFSIPWILGLILPLLSGLLFSALLFSKKDVLVFIKRSLFFIVALMLSQLYWLITLFSNLLSPPYGVSTTLGYALSKNLAATFKQTVLATAVDNIINPLLFLYHRQIAFIFEWNIRDIFLSFYDKTFLINLLFPIILFLGLFSYKKVLSSSSQQMKLYLIFFVAFLVSLFLFTVNIGHFIDIFLALGAFPGFGVFRNFYAKTALGYVFIYSVMLFMSLIIVAKRFPNFRKIVGIAFFFVTLMNFLPAKQLIDIPLWTTKNIHETIAIPAEYKEFTIKMKENIPPTGYILSLPLNVSSYTIINEDNIHVFSGASPIKLFTDIPDLAGILSFSFYDRDRILNYIKNREYDKFNDFLHDHNVNYIFETKNIPKELKTSYLYFRDDKLLSYQNQKLYHGIKGKLVLKSSKGNYELYEAKRPNKILSSKNLIYQKVNDTKYRLYIKNIKSSQNLYFIEPFISGWTLFLEENPTDKWCPNKNNCGFADKLYEGDEVFAFFKKTIFSSSHSMYGEYSNKWRIDPEYIKTHYPKAYYKENPDGSIDIQMTLYFRPQSYFYIGVVISAGYFIFFAAYLCLLKIKSKK